MELVERQTQLDALVAAVDRAGQGVGSTVLVSGEAGIGKTSLLGAFAVAVGGSTRVFEGACEALLTPRTLGPFRDMARGRGGALRTGDRDAVIDALLDELGRSGAPPAVVMVDDAHWADDASLDVIRYLARRVAGLRAVLVVSYRDDEVPDDHPLRQVVGSLGGPAVLHLELPRLSDDVVRRLAVTAGVDPEPVVDAVEGNPFYLTEVLAAPGVEVPPSVRHAVLARVASLPENCRAALEQLAVVPSGAESWLVEALLPDPIVLAAAERRGVVVAEPGLVRFRHELARLAVEHAIPGSMRVELHRRVLRVRVEARAEVARRAGSVDRAGLAGCDGTVGCAGSSGCAGTADCVETPNTDDRGAQHGRPECPTRGEASRLVHHAVGAGDEPAIARYGAMAAHEAAAAGGSHRQVVEFAELALERGELLGPCDVARLHGVAASALRALNRYGEAAEHARAAVELWDEIGAAPLELGEALLVASRLCTVRSDPDGALAAALRARTVLEPLGPGRALALCYSTLGGLDAIMSRNEAAVAWAERALEVALKAGSTDVVARALCSRGLARIALGRESGFTDLEHAVEAAQRSRQGECLAMTAHNLAVAYLRFGHPDRSQRYLEIADQAAEDHKLPAFHFPNEAQWCHLLLWRGDWDEAHDRLRALLRSVASTGSSVGSSVGEADPGTNLVLPLAFLGRLLARRGDGAAQAMVERAWELAVVTGERHKIAVAGGARIEAAWLRGDADAVRTVAAELRAVAAMPGQEFLRAEVLRHLCRAGVEVEPFTGCPPAMAAGMTGDWAAAAKLWAEAGNPYEEALELTESPEPGTVARGLQLLDDLGAVPAAALTRRRLRAEGMRGIPRGPSAATRANPGHLTARQTEVLALLVDGCTNAEIAARLYLSQRTVDNHVAALLDRLGVSSRRCAVDRAVDLGLLRN